MLDKVLYVGNHSDITWQLIELSVSVPNKPLWMIDNRCSPAWELAELLITFYY